MSYGEKAVSLHAEGFNCAQCVLKSCAPDTGVDDALATAVAEGFGGGVRSGEICGAASGGVMAIGLAAAKLGIDRKAVAGASKEYCAEFKEKFGAIRCLDLKKAGHSCDSLIEFGAELAENSINNLKGDI